MSNLILGVGEFGASNNPADVVKTFALGSCVAVILMCPKTRTVGMVHVALPEAKINPEKARTRPGYFADTGIPALLEQMGRMGCDPRGRGFIVKLAGGARIMDPNNTFNIGKRNALAVKKVLWKYALGAVAEDLGETYSRTVAVVVSSGEVILSSPGRGDWKI
ncbi:chemotaxis protein CheD [Desulfuromonas thiophila]|uniref:Probable chemoreceptor glutamine deamidase CheD n=1 Tax=Desulfuromonas thiophila TaxID=57664 RepID=A0A1G7BM36_9BACT|nr:chemotaxis protein CheD [Desulfuromonas thiophila]SDE27750.1 CheD, stimulates methylation of MCP proteins [Desulfuromonas thiophila]